MREYEYDRTQSKQLAEIHVILDCQPIPGNETIDRRSTKYMAYFGFKDRLLVNREVTQGSEFLVRFSGKDGKSTSWTCSAARNYRGNEGFHLTGYLTRPDGDSHAVTKDEGLKDLPSVSLIAKTSTTSLETRIDALRWFQEALDTPTLTTSHDKWSIQDDLKDLERLLLAENLEPRSGHGLFQCMQPAQAQKIARLETRLNRGQRAALDYVRNVQNRFAIISGPPRTGKTEFATILTEIL